MTDSVDSRRASDPQAIHHRYEKAGIVIHDQPIPWNADAVVVEAALQLSSPAQHALEDYFLRITGSEERLPAERIQRETSAGSELRYHITFRIPPLTAPIDVEMFWRDISLARHTIPTLSRQEFLQQLHMQISMAYIRLGEENVCCRSFVAKQCKGLLAAALLTSPTSLIPLLDMPLRAEFHNVKADALEAIPVRLPASQLSGRQALLTAIPTAYPRKMGDWTLAWHVGNQELDLQRLSAVSKRDLEKAIRVSTTRYVVQSAEGELSLSRSLPAGGEWSRLGPCFLVHCLEPGMAGLCQLSVRAQQSAGESPVLFEQEALISEGLTMIAPGTVDAASIKEMRGFELAIKDRVLAVLSLEQSRTAVLNSEGGFSEMPEDPWSSTAEEELSERLSRLLE